MKKIFKLDGLCCANCAAKIEREITNLEGVKDASINFLTTKLFIEADEDNLVKIVESARAIIKKIEPDVNMQKV